jgi:hypothetical protein
MLYQKVCAIKQTLNMTLFLSEVLTALYTYLFMFHTMNNYIEKKFSVK